MSWWAGQHQGALASVTTGPSTSGIRDTKMQAWCWPRVAWDMSVEFLGLWNWAEDQSWHFSPEEHGKKHHKHGAQDQGLAQRDKERAQSLTRCAPDEPDQQQNSPKRRRCSPKCWGKFESDVWTGSQRDHCIYLHYFGSSPSPDTYQLGNLEQVVGRQVSVGLSQVWMSYERGTEYSLFQIYLFEDICIISCLGKYPLFGTKIKKAYCLV